MPFVLELRNRTTHAGVVLVHKTAEDVVVATVFGILKNLPPKIFTNPWLSKVSAGIISGADDWEFSFWERQRRPICINEGSTEVDIVLQSKDNLVFIEAKIDAQPSTSTTHIADRNQLLRNLDIGYHRAKEQGKRFTLIFLTPDLRQPTIVESLRANECTFPVNPQVPQENIAACLYWSSWAQIADTLCAVYQDGINDSTINKFALDVMAYLTHKRLWRNTLPDDERFYSDKILRALQKSDSPFIPYESQRAPTDQSWRNNDWSEEELLKTLGDLRYQDKILLKFIAENGGAVTQKRIFTHVSFVKRNSGKLRSAKSHINAVCRSMNRAPILQNGFVSGNQRIHQINPALGDLRKIVIKQSKSFQIPAGVV